MTPKSLRHALPFFLLIIGALAARAATPGAPVEFDSPEGRFHVRVQPGDAGGSDLLPLAVVLTSTATGRAVTINVQARGYVAPTAATAARLLHFSPDESAVAVDNPPSASIFGYRVTPLTPRAGKRPWTGSDIEGEGAEWADENRLVFRGQATDVFYIGVLNARTGRLHRADPSLSMYTNFELIHVTPTTLVFREEDTSSGREGCLAFDTAKAKRRVGPCPGS